MTRYDPSLWDDDEPFVPMHMQDDLRKAKRQTTRGGRVRPRGFVPGDGAPKKQRRPSLLSPEAWDEEQEQLTIDRDQP